MKIKLGKLPDSRKVNLNVTLSAELKARIDRYAAFYSKTWAQQVDARSLIPHILSQFVASDRSFKKLEQANCQTIEKNPNEQHGNRGSVGS